MADTSPDKECGVAASPPPKRERSPIFEEEDRILDDSSTGIAQKDEPVVKTIAEKEQAHKHKIEEDKIKIGSNLLIACFTIIFLFAIIDISCDSSDGSTLFSSAFEFAKTIATALVGYLFATNAKEK